MRASISHLLCVFVFIVGQATMRRLASGPGAGRTEQAGGSSGPSRTRGSRPCSVEQITAGFDNFCA